MPGEGATRAPYNGNAAALKAVKGTFVSMAWFSPTYM